MIPHGQPSIQQSLTLKKLWAAAAVLALCTLPALLNLLGIDFGSQSTPLDDQTIVDGEIPTDALFYALAGAMHHALLEWSAVSIAVLTALVSFIHYSVKRDPTIPIIGMALLSAGLVDSFHTLAATRLIEANAPNKDFIPFTWAISRIFNASIMLIGVTINLWLLRSHTEHKFSSNNRLGIGVIVISSILFLGLSYAVVHIAAVSDNLPQTMYPNALITRPLDVLPLALFLLGGTLFWAWYKQNPAVVKFGLVISVVPEIATQLHMAFGSTQLFDNHFNIAHGLKNVAYGTIFFGVLIDLISIQKTTQPSSAQVLPEGKSTSPSKPEATGQFVDIDFARRPLGVQIPIASFILSLGSALIVGLTFYFENERLVIDKELDSLEHQSQLIHPLLTDYYTTPFKDASFFSKTPAVRGIVNSTREQQPKQLEAWKRRLEEIFKQILETREMYSEMRFIGVANNGLELVNVRRIPGEIVTLPQSRMQQKDHRPYFQESINYIEGAVYFSPIELRHDQGKIATPHTPVMRVATPIYDHTTGDVFGIVIISTNFNKFLQHIRDAILSDTLLYLANGSGDFLVHPDSTRTFGFDLGQRHLLQDEFEQLQPVITNNINSAKVFDESDTDTASQKASLKNTGYYSVIQLYQFGISEPLRMFLQFQEHSGTEELIALRNRSLVLAFSLAFIVLALSVLATRRVISPLTEMTDSVRDYENTGTLEKLPLNSRDEIGVLARSFNNLLQTKKLQETEIRETRKYIDGITEGVPLLLAYIDKQQKFKFVNKNYADWFHINIEQLIDREIENTIFSSDYQLLSPYINAVLQGKHIEFDHTLQTKDSKIGTVHLTFTPDFDEDDNVRGFFASGEDITQRKVLEEDLKDALKIAQESVELKSSFLASMSHEIRTPMNGVLGMLGLLKREKLTQKQRHYLNLAKSSADSLLTLINDILDFSKIEAGRLELEEIDFDILNQLGEFSETMAHKAQDKGLELILDVTQVNYHMVKGDPGRLRQILTNLVYNAIKFTEQGEILIRAGLEDAGDSGLILFVSVSDTGIGIPEDKINSLFDSFTQVDASTTRKFGGTGLGLAIVKQLCELMGGSISVNSEEGKGSQFNFSLRLHKSNQPLKIQSHKGIKNSNILVVDDNATNREVLKGQLSSWGAEVVTAKNGQQALTMLKNYLPDTFDAAILDMQMPEMDGATLGKIIRENSEYDCMPMVMMTSIGDRGDAKHFSELGFSAYFPKPATTSDLYNALGIVTGAAQSQNDQLPLVTRHNVHALAGSAMNHNLRILLVEDNPTNQAVATGMLDDIGLNADVAFNGQEALNALNDSPADANYHIILMDCQMPVLDGYQTTQAIRRGEAGSRYKDIVIIAMTANAMEGDREKCLSAGMTDYMSKPINGDTLEQKLLQYSGEHKAQIPHRMPQDHNNAEPASSMPFQQTDVTEEESSDIWDKAAALKRVRNKPERLAHLVQLFLDDMPERIKQLEAAVERDDDKEVVMLAHTIKGVAGNLSAISLHQVAGELETAAKAAAYTKLPNLLEDLLLQFSQLVIKLEENTTTDH